MEEKKLGLKSVISVSVGLVIATSCLVSLGQGAGTIGVTFIFAMVIACLLPSGRVCFEERGEVRTQKKVCTCFGTADFQFSLMLFEIIQLQQFQLLL